MKTAGMSDAVLPLTKKQKAISNVVMGVLFLAAGVIIVLASVGEIGRASCRERVSWFV